MLVYPYRTLLVDADATLLEDLAHGLRRLGLNISTCANSDQALQLVQARPDIRILVTDLQMPGMGGLELVRRLAELRQRPAMAAIVLTGQATLDGVIEALRLKVVDLLHKPVTAEELAAVVRRAVQTLEASSGLPHTRSPDAARPAAGEREAVCVDMLLAEYQDRDAVFGATLFDNTRWVLLLRLALAPQERSVPLQELDQAQGPGLRTVRRCLRNLADAGLVEELSDADRRRRAFRLTSEGRRRIALFLDRLATR